MRALYSVLLYLLTPLVVLRLLWRSRELRDYRLRMAERFGYVPTPAEPVAVWVHAVSVGESLAALPLIRALVARYGERRVWVTTTTPTGSTRVIEALGNTVLHSYAPYDLPHVVARFLRRVRPRRVIIMETELWPNLFRALHRSGVALTIANARLSPRSFRGYGRVRGFARATLSDCSLIAAQSAADAERFRALGAPAQRVEAIGNLKFDQTIPEAQLRVGAMLREWIGRQRPVWIAASTHEGEDALVLQAHRQLREALPDALLILVPRHPQRFDAVGRLVESSGLGLTRRSQLDLDALPPPPDAAAVLLGDSMGEMFAYFAASDVAFVGGSLVAVGGHNVLEPAALGQPVLFGPYMHNFVAARDLLLEAGAGLAIDAETLASQLKRLLSDPAQRQRMGDAGRAAVDQNRGALQRLLDRVV